MSKLKVAIVILNWNGAKFLQKFLPSVIANSVEDGVKVIVADNGSSDDSLSLLTTEFSAIRTIKFDKNYGYSSGYNLALKQIDAEYYVLLNSDVETPKGWLKPLIDFMDSHPNAGACMPKLLDYNRRNFFEYAGAAGGFVDLLGYPYCRGRILSHIEEDKGQYDQPIEIFWATGACMFIRSKTFWDAGGLDDHFFAHMEEIDLCWRVKRLGGTVWCVPASHVFHVGGGTLPNNNPFKLMLNYRNNLLMLHKNLNGFRKWGVMFLRFSLDWASAFVYFITGRIALAGSVFDAYRSFFKLASIIKSKKLQFEQNHNLIEVRCKRLILFDFFILNRKVFSEG